MYLQEELPCRNEAAEISRQEYHAPEPHDEDEDPQWIQTDPEFASGSGDGPDSLEEYNPEKDKAGKRKRNHAKPQRRLRGKRKQRDHEDRPSKYCQRTKNAEKVLKTVLEISKEKVKHAKRV